MGCGGSKIDDLPLVIRCRARKEMIKSAMDYRYDLSSSHVAYFRSLKEVSYALSRFVDEELVVSSSSSASSPVLTLPSDEGKTNSSVSHIHSIDGSTGSHLHLSSDSDSESDLHSSPGSHIYMVNDGGSVRGNEGRSPFSSFYPYYNHNQADWGNGFVMNAGDPYGTNSAPSPYRFGSGGYASGWGTYGGVFYPYSGNSGLHYMKKSAPASNTFLHKEERGFRETGQWPDQSDHNNSNPTKAPSPPPPPNVSGWDFLNFFEGYENGYQSYGYGYEHGPVVSTSSPDTDELREREGIPDLEEETEIESHSEEVKLDTKRSKSEEGTTRSVSKEDTSMEQSQSNGDSSKRMPSSNSESTSNSVPSNSIDIEVDTSIRTVSESVGEKKDVSFDVEDEVESSRLSGLTRLSPQGSWGLQEVFNEIKNEFDIVCKFEKEVAVMLEAGKVPYRPKFAVLKVALSRILDPFSSSLHLKQSEMSRSQTTKLARSYHLDAVASISLSSTLEKLYTWEKKLYKQVKDEERLRLKYDNLCKRLKDLDARGAEHTEIDVVRVSVRRTLTKLDVRIKTIDAISIEIQKVRDEELQPQLSELIYGFVRMWKLIVKCHRKQFQAINASKTWNLKANINHRSDNATLVLIIGVMNWCKHFEDWINAQKSFVSSLNSWLQECIDRESEETVDGKIPFSPGRIGAPPIFIICNDWHTGVKRVAEEHVSASIRVFASNLRQLVERRDDERHQRLKTKQLAKDFSEKRQNLRIGAAETGVAPPDDRKAELRLLRKMTEEGRARHKEAVKVVHGAASSCVNGGLIPVFKALQDFSCDAYHAHEQVRLQNQGKLA